MKINTLQDQNKILKKHFKIEINIANCPSTDERADGIFLIPHYTKIAPTEWEAMQKVMTAIDSTRSFTNYPEGKIDEKHFRSLPRSTELPEIVSAQLGKKWVNTTVEDVRSRVDKGEVLMTAYEALMIVLLNPDVQSKQKDIGIDCAGTEYSYSGNGVFEDTVGLYFYDRRLKFDRRFLDIAYDYFGAGSFFVSKSNLDTRPLVPFESDLNLESAIKICKEAGYIIQCDKCKRDL